MLAPLEESKELTDVLVRIRSWSTQTRLALIKSIIDSLAETSGSTIKADEDVPTLEELEGYLDTGAPPPTDEECERWLDDERMRKYG